MSSRRSSGQDGSRLALPRRRSASRPPASSRSVCAEHSWQRRANMADDCLFCRIVKQEIPVPLLYDEDGVVAFRDINPQAPTHILVIPRQHIASLNETTDAAAIGQLALAAAKIAKDEGIASSGYRTVINTNKDAGQTVFHVHLHLLGGRHLAWPPG